jgi:F-type H+-transporting ATPase subunit b
LKRWLGCFVLLIALAGFAAAQQEGPTERREAAEEKSPSLPLLWANFAILAVGLGYLIRKHVPPLLRARSEEIQKSMRESAQLKAESDARLADIERRLKGIGNEIDKLRVELISEMNAEGGRLREETERQVKRIHDQAQQEIQFMTKAGRLELKAFSAQLAIDLASQRIQARMNPDTQHNIVNAFIAGLGTSHRGITAK